MQPDQGKPISGGMSALESAAAKGSGTRSRHVPTPKKTKPPQSEQPPTEPEAAEAPVQKEPENTAEKPAEAPKPPSDGKDRGRQASSREKGSQGDNSSSRREPHRDENERHGGEVDVIAPPAPVVLPDFARLQARQNSGMDPTEQAMYTRALEVMFMQVSKSYREMMSRQQDLISQVQRARAAGYPESELELLAAKHSWEVPVPHTQQ